VRSSCLIPFIVVLALSAGEAQEPAFDVASIRPNISGGNTTFRPTATGRITATNVTLRTLVLRAYGLHDSQLIDAPEWTAVERFDIDARVERVPASGPDALMPLLRTLLVDRFQLKARVETRELPAYALVHARRDRRLGDQIRTTRSDCTKPTVMTDAELLATVKADAWPPCGQLITSTSSTKTPEGSVVITIRVRRSGATMKELAAWLQPVVGGPVVDRSGLEGLFDLEYSFAPMASSPSAAVAVGANVPSLFVALEEQLGLKLESERTAVPVVVIDAVSRPTEN
jgi:uncharacterized protein (TIGR03435 family)